MFDGELLKLRKFLSATNLANALNLQGEFYHRCPILSGTDNVELLSQAELGATNPMTLID